MTIKSFSKSLTLFTVLVLVGCGGGGGGTSPASFKYKVYDDFSDPGGNIDFTLWNPVHSPYGTSLLIVDGGLNATAVKNSDARADQGLWVKDVTSIKMADFQAFRADFTILEATGNATNRAQILLGFPLETANDFVDTGINFYASGEVKYYIDIWNSSLGQSTADIVWETIAMVDPAVPHTLSIGWDGSNYIFQVDNIAPVVIPMSAETDISKTSNWGWATVRATVKDAGTGTTVAKIDNVQRGGL